MAALTRHGRPVVLLRGHCAVGAFGDVDREISMDDDYRFVVAISREKLLRTTTTMTDSLSLSINISVTLPRHVLI